MVGSARRAMLLIAKELNGDLSASEFSTGVAALGLGSERFAAASVLGALFPFKVLYCEDI